MRINKKINLLIGIILLIGVLTFKGSPVANEHISFVEVNSTHLEVNDTPFKFIGANAVYLIFYDELGFNMEKVFRAARENGIRVMRVYMNWGGWSRLVEYDKILKLASEYGIYIIMTLTDCSRSADYNSLKDYFKERPYCNVKNIKAYKDWIKKIIMRKNFFTGKSYRNDPIILAWDIANEIEYWRFNTSKMKKWINEISNYVKSIDPNHLVTMGIDVSPLREKKKLWNIFKGLNIDFYSLHYYAFGKEKSKNISEAYKRRLRSNIKKFLLFNKPVILEEFDVSSSEKINQRLRKNSTAGDIYYTVFENIMNIAFSSGCSGAMFWGWGVPEAKQVSYWWAPEIHSIKNENFTDMIKNYEIP